MSIRFPKTDQRGTGHIIIIIPEGTSLCPNPCRDMSNRVLGRCVSFAGLPLQCYTSHSFRIGAATSAAMGGYSDSQIQVIGRWTSHTFHSYRRYIRLDDISVLNA